MKIRNGFVSNSSSSSFLLYGWRGKYSEAVELLQTTELGQDYIERLAEKYYKGDIAKAVEDTHALSMFTQGEGYNDDRYHYLGLSWDCVLDSETGTQFKERVAKLVKSWLGEEASKHCGTYQEAWYDG